MKKMLLLCSAFVLALQSWAQLPKADVLDVVFNDDGTATDVSPMANEVITMGTPSIVASPRWGMNLLCTAKSPMGSKQENAYKVMINEQIWAAIKTGHSIECFVRPFWDGALNPNGWGTVVGLQQWGGTGLLIYNGQWLYEPHVAGVYVDAYGGRPLAHKWVHLVGTYDQSTGKVSIFVDGVLVQSVEQQGEMTYPQVEAPFIAIGGDLSQYDHIEAGFPGDIALARIYSKALTEEEVSALYAEVKSKDTGAADHKEESRFSDLRYDENGAVLIATAKDLNDFALLSKISPATSAKLEADIDYTAYNDNICQYGTKFGGVFDGNGHTITVNFDFTGVETTGFIADAKSGAEVKNLTLEGNVTGNMRWNGVLYGSNYGAVTRNVVIKANLNSTRTAEAYAGVLSGWDDHTCTYENIVIETTLSGDATHMGALVGDVAGTTYLKNVLVVANSSVTDPTKNSPLVACPRNGTHYENVYFVNDNGLELSTTGATQIEAIDVTNGSACFLLNRGNVLNPSFYQDVTSDPLPSFDATRGVVVRTGTSYLSVTDDAASISEAAESVATGETDYAATVEAYEGLKTELSKQAEVVRASVSRDQFLVAYDSVLKIRKRIDENLVAYEAYRVAAETINASLTGMTSEAALQLIDYINEELEPNELYKNGTYLHIYTYKTLDTKAIYDEIAYMEAMQKKVSASDAPAGADITVLLNNPDFSNGFAGWKGTALSGSGTNGTSWAAENWGSNSFDLYQEIRGLKNGVYAFTLQGTYRPFDDINANQYWPLIYANGNVNYLQSLREDMIPVDQAVDRENCYLTPGVDNYVDDAIMDIDGKVLGYVCHGIQGSCYAFQAGRYKNIVLVNVTDGTLRVGVNHTYSECNSNEWVSLGNAKLTYCGTTEEAGQYLDEALAAMSARASTLLSYTWSDSESYRWLPNYSQSLKDRLSQLILAVSENPAASPAEKYAWIESFSQTFAQIKESKMAYRRLAATALSVFDRATDYPGHEQEIYAAHDQTWEEWRQGVFATPEEVQAKIDQLNAMLDVLPLEIPTPDVFDIVFNADGSATDISPLKNQVSAMGETHVVESPVLKRNVFCLAQNEWSQTPDAYYRVEMTDTLQSLMADGITMECLVRPTWVGDAVPSEWVSCFGYEEGGGLGMIVYNGRWTFEAHVGGGYKDAVGLVPVKDKWVHLLGVWNKTEGKLTLYMDGQFAGSVPASGDLAFPYITEPHWMGIGADMPKNGQAAFPGDIAIMRLYNDPINASQANKIYRNLKATMLDVSEHDCGNTVGIADVIQSVPSVQKGIFNIMGQKVTRTTKGLYIIDGKKVLVK